MTEPATKGMRFILALTKVPVMDVTQTLEAQRVKLALGGSTTMTFDVTNAADVRIGDILTLYTEVPIREAN